MADRLHQKLIADHQEWLGYVQPVGLVVSPSVMVNAGVIIDGNITDRQKEFLSLLSEVRTQSTAKWIAKDLRSIIKEYLGWEDQDFADIKDHRDELEKSLPELNTVLSPTWAVRGGESDWMMLIRVEDADADLDKPPIGSHGWNASINSRFERLLRETNIPIGLLCTNERIRLIYAPKGESSGHITFEFSQMALPAGRSILSAFTELFSAESLFSGDTQARLPSLLSKSREAQAEVSTQLSKQVLASLYELLRGFVATDSPSNRIITELARTSPDHLYEGLITTLMRLIFILYAEDRGLMPDHPVYQQHYSLSGLFVKLRDDKSVWPDTMDQRYGAWAQLLALFRLIHDGGSHGELHFVARKGTLFDPGRFPFLEGRYLGQDVQDQTDSDEKFERVNEGKIMGEILEAAPPPISHNKHVLNQIPLISDACVGKILDFLMVLKGERLSYRTLDVEQIGSVYEAIMGFRVELSSGRSIAVRSQTKTGASVIVDLERLLGIEGSKRTNELKSLTGRELTRKVSVKFRKASTVEDLIAVIDGVIDRDATPSAIGPETPILQPTDERRKSGSHYTPRSLTQPIVEEALRPILERLGDCPRPEDILSIKVLDPATGSGAFLVEVCRHLAEQLVKAWAIHGGSPEKLVDDDELLHARRIVAQRCLYGVDKNPMAVDLAKLSIWLVTLAQNHEFTFIDHALRHGDSLVGLARRQIELFHWKDNPKGPQASLHSQEIDKACRRVSELRQLIQQLGGEIPEEELQDLMDEMNHELRKVRQIADLIILAFFNGKKVTDRKEFLSEYANLIQHGDEESKRKIDDLTRELPFSSFHWELEFPEVFERENGGFDAVVGNPPFAGKNTIAGSYPPAYPHWLKAIHAESHGNADLAAHFFRRAFNLLRDKGTLGLIATNTISQGDTRSTGLQWICENGGEIYRAQRRFKWPGEAAVIVSVIHITNGEYDGNKILDDKRVELITAFLFYGGGHGNPETLKRNLRKSFVGSYVLGMGFTFDDLARNRGVASPISEMEGLIQNDPRNQEIIFPYIGGEEVNSSPVHSHHRYVINFHAWPLRREDLGILWVDANENQRKQWLQEGIVPRDYPDSVAEDWPELLRIVEEKVRPGRAHLTRNSIGRKRKKFWWQFGGHSSDLYDSLTGIDRILAISTTTSHIQFTFLIPNQVFSLNLAIISQSTYACFCALQSRIHEIWARFFGSTLEDRLCYTPTDCFETFPFPLDWETLPSLESAGEACYNFRADLMVHYNEGMTKTYNRFHHPEERSPDIIQLRRLHADMDRAVLDAYGWTDIPTDCEFLLDYEIDHETWGKKRKPYRYRWPDEIHDEVLSRLLALNAKYAEQERIEGRNKRK